MHGMKFMMLLCVAGALLAGGCMSPFYEAAKRGDATTVKELLDKGADIDQHFGDSELGRPFGRDTALMLATCAGHVELMRLLLDRGADVNLTREPRGYTALSCAAWAGQTDAARLLIERGADIYKAIVGLRNSDNYPFRLPEPGVRDAVEFLNKLEPNGATPTQEQGSPAAPQALPTALPPPRETGATF